MPKTRIKLVKQDDGSVAAFDLAGEVDARASGPKAKEELMELYKGAISPEELEFEEQGFDAPPPVETPSNQPNEVEEPEPENPETHMVPYAALKAERDKRKTLHTELEALKASPASRSVSPQTPPVAPPPKELSDAELVKQVFGEEIDNDGLMTVAQGAKILRTAIGLVTAQQQLQQFDSLLDEFASRPEKPGMMLSPKKVAALVRPYIANNTNAKLQILNSTNPQYVLYKLAQEIQTLSDLELVNSIPDVETPPAYRPPVANAGVTVHPNSKGRTARELANDRTRTALDAQSSTVHPSSQVAGDNNLNTGDPSANLVNQFKNIGNVWDYAREYAKLTPEQKAALDSRFN